MTDATKTSEILSIKNMSFRYNGRTLFDGANCTIEKGDMVGIIGGNGSGKTTLVKLMLGLLKPNGGSIEWFLDGECDGGKLGRVEYIAQDVTHTKSVLPTSVEEVVATGTYFSSMENHKHVADGCCYDSIDRALDHVGIMNLRKKRINELSGGQKQRVYIARALIAHPEVLIMDEPLSWVDAETQKQLYVLLDHLNKVHDITVIMISHDQEEIGKYMRTIISVGNSDSAGLQKIFPSQRIVCL